MKRIAEAFHPSEYIQDELDARGWKLDDLVARMGGDQKVQQLAMEIYMNTDDPGVRLGDDGAADLAKAFGTSKQIWLGLERAWLRSHPMTNQTPSLTERLQALKEQDAKDKPFDFSPPSEGWAGDYSVSVNEVRWINRSRTLVPALLEALEAMIAGAKVAQNALSVYSDDDDDARTAAWTVDYALQEVESLLKGSQ